SRHPGSGELGGSALLSFWGPAIQSRRHLSPPPKCRQSTFDRSSHRGQSGHSHSLRSELETPIHLGMEPCTGAVVGHSAKVDGFLRWLFRPSAHSIGILVLAKSKPGGGSPGGECRRIRLPRPPTAVSASPVCWFSGSSLLYVVALDR